MVGVKSWWITLQKYKRNIEIDGGNNYGQRIENLTVGHPIHSENVIKIECYERRLRMDETLGWNNQIERGREISATSALNDSLTDWLAAWLNVSRTRLTNGNRFTYDLYERYERCRWSTTETKYYLWYLQMWMKKSPARPQRRYFIFFHFFSSSSHFRIYGFFFFAGGLWVDGGEVVGYVIYLFVGFLYCCHTELR